MCLIPPLLRSQPLFFVECEASFDKIVLVHSTQCFDSIIRKEAQRKPLKLDQSVPRLSLA
jgi:hypothetical protein